MRVSALVLTLVIGCSSAGDHEATASGCFDELDRPVACEDLGEVPEIAPGSEQVEDEANTADAPGDELPGPDDLDGAGDEATEIPFDELPAGDELEGESKAGKLSPKTPGEKASTAFAWGRTDTPELRKTIPIGRTSGATRYVVMRLRPSEMPNLRLGDVLRAAAEIQVTTRCDIGQVAPGCNYSPKVRMQLLLSGNADATHANGTSTIALSDVSSFECTKDEHHCVKIINFQDGSKTLGAGNAPACVNDNSCYVNFVLWAYDDDARSGGADKLIVGANEGNYLETDDTEQDRGRLMVIRERNVSGADKSYRVTDRNVKNGPITLTSNGDYKRIYSHTLKGGQDLKAGEKYRVWMLVDATANHRVNLSFNFFLTKNRYDHNGARIEATAPTDFSEHNGTNCSPEHPCHVRKVAVFEVKQDIKGPVYANIAASTEVPGPGVAQTTIKNSGYVKSIRYSE